MKKTRLILALLMILTMLVFAGCADTKDNGAAPGNGTTQENGTGTTGNGVKDDLENAGDNIKNDVNKAADNAKGSVTGGGVDDNTVNPAPAM